MGRGLEEGGAGIREEDEGSLSLGRLRAGGRTLAPITSSPHYPIAGGLSRGGVPQRPPEIASPCMLFSAASREEGRGWPGVEQGRRKGQVGAADGVAPPWPGPSLTSPFVETVEIEARLTMAIG